MPAVSKSGRNFDVFWVRTHLQICRALFCSSQVAALACDQLREDGPLKTVFRSSSFLEVIHQRPHIISRTNMAILGVRLSYRQIFFPVHPFAAATTGPSQKHRPHRSRLCQHLQATISKSQQHSYRSASCTI